MSLQDQFHHQGFVHTRGPNSKKWMLSYVMLRRGYLSFFLNEVDYDFNMDLYPVEIVSLASCEFGDVKKREGHKFCFSLVKPHEKKWKYDFSLADPEDLAKWEQTLRNNWVLSNPVTFGSTIDRVCMLNNSVLPLLVVDMVNNINDKYMLTEGIFRIPGHQGNTIIAKEVYNSGDSPDIERMEVHTNCGLLKLYFRELTDPLIPMSHYRTFINTGSLHGDEFKAALKDAIESLPRHHLITLTYLFEFLGRVSLEKQVNLMTPENIATCFGPTIIREKGIEDKSFDPNSLADMSAANAIAKSMVDFRDELFDFSILDQINDKLVPPTEGRLNLFLTESERNAIEPVLIDAVPAIVLNTKTLWELFTCTRLNLETRNGVFDDRIFFAGTNRFFLFHPGGRPDCNYHYLDIDSIYSTNRNRFSIKLKNMTTFNFTAKSVCLYDVDNILSSIYESVNLGSFSDLFPFNIKPPSRAQDILSTSLEKTASCCDGMLETYFGTCEYLGYPINNEVVWDLEQLYDEKDVHFLDLAEISQPQKYPQDVRTLLTSMKYCSWFTKLVVEDFVLSNDVISEIGDLMGVDRDVEELVLRGCGLSKITWETLGTKIKENSLCRLTSLDISNNVLEERGACVIASLLEQGAIVNLRTLKMSRVEAGKKGLTSLFTNLTQLCAAGIQNLTELDISQNKLEKDSSRTLGEFLEATRSLISLDISGTGCNYDIVTGFFVNPNQSIQKINLSGNKFQTKQMLSTSQMMSLMPNLTDVDLSSTGINRTVVCSLFTSNENVQKLNLNYNDFSDETFKELFTELLEKPSVINLTELKIDDCLHVGRKVKQRQEAIRAIVNLVNLNYLKKISFAGSRKNPLKADIVPFIYNLISNTTLRYLDISGHLSGDILANTLAKVIPQNHVLKTLVWDDNEITLPGFKVFLTGLSRNTSLSSVPFPFKDVTHNVQDQEEMLKVLLKIQDKLNENTKNRYRTPAEEPVVANSEPSARIESLPTPTRYSMMFSDGMDLEYLLSLEAANNDETTIEED